MSNIDQISNLQSLRSLISSMENADTMSQRLHITESLLTITDKNILDQLIPLKVIHSLSKWIHEYKEEKIRGMEIPPDEIKIIIDIVNLCQRVELKKNDLKSTKIGKNINKLGKALNNNNQAKKYCEDIVSKWRKMIDEDDERIENNTGLMGKKTNRDKNYVTSSKNISNVNYISKKIKSCLKKEGDRKKHGKVTFNDEELTQVKIFKATDPPNAPNISHEEYLKIQHEVAQNPHIYKFEDIRKKEINMDNNQPKKAEIPWRQPLRLIIENQIETGKNSKEKIQIEDKCSKLLSVTYFTSIPEPKDGDCQLFAFDDENIPKIENSHNPTHTNDVTIEDIFQYIDTLQNKTITQDNVNEISEKLEGIENISQDDKNKIINELKSKIRKEETINHIPEQIINTLPNPNPNPIIKQIPTRINLVQPKIPIQQIPPAPQTQISNNQIDPRMFMESASRMNILKYKTKACRHYHSSVGCTRGENCFFIHDPQYKGVEIPNFDSRNYEKKFPNFIGVPIGMNPIMNTNIPNYYNPRNNININMNINQNQTVQKGEEDGEIIIQDNTNNNIPKSNITNQNNNNNNNNNTLLNRTINNIPNMILPQTMMLNRPPINNMMMGYFRTGLNMGNIGMGMGMGLNPMMNLPPNPIQPNLNHMNNQNNSQ